MLARQAGGSLAIQAGFTARLRPGHEKQPARAPRAQDGMTA
jgi:hypothetical protein